MLGSKTKHKYLGMEMEHSLEANVLRSKLRSGENKLKKYFSPFDVCLPPGFLFSHCLLLHSPMNFSLTVNVEWSLCMWMILSTTFHSRVNGRQDGWASNITNTDFFKFLRHDFILPMHKRCFKSKKMGMNSWAAAREVLLSSNRWCY